MTGKGRFLVCGIAIIMAGVLVLSLFLLMKTGPTTEEGGANLGSIEDTVGASGLPGDALLEELEGVYSTDQALGGDLNTTVVYDYVRELDKEVGEAYACSPYHYETLDLNVTNSENLAFLSLANVYIPPPEGGMTDGVWLGDRAVSNLAFLQEPDGSWNHDVSDTAVATYALAKDYGPTNHSVQRGASWLASRQINHGWGSNAYDAKAILAMGEADVSVDAELGSLLSRQAANGSFGGVDQTAWAVMAISKNLDESNYLDAALGVSWLRSQEIDDAHSLALAALAEQYYNMELEASGIGTQVYNRDTGTSVMYGITGLVLVGAGIVIVLFARLREEDVLDGVRKEIFEYIEENPGEHLASITRQFGISSSSARHHLDVLEWSDRIVSYKSGKHKHFYPNRNGFRMYTNGHGYKEIMSTLKNDTTRNMVKFLISHDGSNQKSIAEALDLHPSTVNWHAKRLRSANIISKAKHGKDIRYSLNGDLDLVKVISLIEGASS